MRSIANASSELLPRRIRPNPMLERTASQGFRSNPMLERTASHGICSNPIFERTAFLGNSLEPRCSSELFAMDIRSSSNVRRRNIMFEQTTSHGTSLECNVRANCFAGRIGSNRSVRANCFARSSLERNVPSKKNSLELNVARELLHKEIDPTACSSEVCSTESLARTQCSSELFAHGLRSNPMFERTASHDLRWNAMFE